MIKLGIAGMGYIGQVHLGAARKVPEVQVLAVASLEPEKARELVPGVDIHTRYEDLFCDQRLDAVIVGLPTDLHEQAVITAAECGRDILCEKPWRSTPPRRSACFRRQPATMIAF